MTAKPVQTNAESYEITKRRQANIRNLNKKIESAEAKIEETEVKIEELKSKIMQAGSDYDKVSELYAEQEKCENELELLYELWNTLSKDLESIV